MFFLKLVFIFSISTGFCECLKPSYPKCNSFNQDATILNSLDGKIQGACYNIPISTSYKVTTTKNPVLTWLAVPYAKPPTGCF
jgi:hypothetical protein